VLPALEAPKLEQVEAPFQLFAYSDEEGPAPAFGRASLEPGLAGARIGVENLHMRLGGHPH